MTLSRTTDETHGSSGSATKRFVDGKITITPSAVNEVGEAHTFTVDVEQDDGLVADAPGGDAVTGFGPVTVGNADVTLTDANGAARP